MNIHTIKANLKAVYPNSPSWAAKVSKMSDAQAFAVHARFVRESKIKI